MLIPLRREMERLRTYYGHRLRCVPGCCACCGELSVLPLEAAMINAAYAGLAPDLRTRIRDAASAGREYCPFLVNRLCAIYGSRPLICRTHGLPIAYVNQEQGAIEVSACPENFSLDSQFDHGGLLFLDRFNGELQALNQRFARETGRDPGQRISLSRIVLPGRWRARKALLF